MSNIKKNATETKRMLDDLQDQLDRVVFEQNEVDPDKVKEILNKMDSISPDESKDDFDKELLWGKIMEECREEFAEENPVSFSDAKEGKAVSENEASKAEKSKEGNSSKIRKAALTAATLIIAVFLGANLGTYATERKSVIQYVQDLKNGTSFWVMGDAASMEFETVEECYFSWNEVPEEYKGFLLIPENIPDYMQLYDIKIQKKKTLTEAIIRYIDAEAKKDFTIRIASYGNEDKFTFANLSYEDRYELLEEKRIGDYTLNYYIDESNETVAQLIKEKCIYTFSGTLGKELMQAIVEKTIESNF